MSSVNKVIIIGNVGKDPEIRTTQSGSKIANLSVATSESWKDKATGEKKEKTEWHRIVVYNDSLCNVIERYVIKGTKIYVEGQLETRKWTDKDGVDRYSTEIVIKAYGGGITLLSSKTHGTEVTDQGQEPEKTATPAQDIFEDDIPF